MAKVKGINPDGKVVEINGDEWEKGKSVRAEKTKSSYEKRSRRFCLTTYIDSGAIENHLCTLPWVQHWAMITHDRDVNEDGTPKEVHAHVLLYTYDPKTSSGVRKNFDYFSREYYSTIGGEPQNTMVQVMHDSASQWRYLIHADNPEKAQYSHTERICDDYAYWHKLDYTKGMNDSANNTALQIINDMLAGVSTMELCTRYGKDFVYHLPRYKEVLRDIVREENDRFFDNGSKFKITEFLPFMLADCPYNKGTVNAFYMVLDYLRQQCVVNFDSKFDFCLDQRINTNTGEIEK